MKFTKNLKHILIITIITFLLIIGLMRFFGEEFLRPLTHFFIYREIGIQSKIYPYHFQPSKDISIIKIDEVTINTLQSNGNLKMLSIPKSVYIDVIKKLESVGAKGVAFDILFQNSDPDEQKFADTIKNSKINVVIGASSEFCTPYDTPEQYIKKGEAPYYCDMPFVGSAFERKISSGNTKFNIAKCLTDTGSINFTCDGFPRSIYNDVTWGAVNINEQVDSRAAGFSIFTGSYFQGQKYVGSLAYELYQKDNPLMSSGIVLQPFFGAEGIYPQISLYKFLEMSKLDLVKNYSGKYVFIGESGTMIHDQLASPVTGEMMDGVETYAHMLDGILQKRNMTEVDSVTLMTIILLIVVCTGGLYIVLPKFLSPVIAFILIIISIFICRYLYFNYGIVVSIFPLILAIGLLSFPVTYIYKFFVIDQEKRFLKQAFAHYIDPTVVSDIAENASDIVLGGENRDLSVLFSDIAGFTTISEKLPPTELFYLMSSYLSQMTDILIKNGGTLDKYIGDAVMGFFGAPIHQDDHSLRSCRTALAMRAALPAFNAELIKSGMDPIDFRVGIASGEVVVGNIGSHDRFNYTVLGDTVNLASRLEATSKEYGTRVIVSESTYLAVKDHFFARKLDLIAVKGKHEGVGIYELISDIDDATVDRKKYDRYAIALELYFQGKYEDAGKAFEVNMQDDPPSKVMMLRCVDLINGVVKLENGVFVMTHK